ncbi:unnamed protein product [Durusdinium trenchii]|uniref:Uncharacterized protein n=2 Tax=Durusdinium trenchii TaxID=1381693 RepID=A0ABP0IT74_9DINO
MRVGDIAYLKLDQFEPAWRQGLVVASSPKSSRLVLAVRCTTAELREKGSGLSSFDCKECRYILVEGRPAQIRASCDQPLRGLEVSTDALLKTALEALDSEDLQYATASEDLPITTPAAGSKMGQQPELLGSGTESSLEEDGSGDELIQLLQRAKRTDLGKASSSDRPAKIGHQAKGRYPFLTHQSREAKGSSDGVQKLFKKALSADPAAELTTTNLNALISMELLRTLKGKERRRDRVSSPAGSDRSDDSSLESSSSRGKRGGASKALRAYRQGHREMRRNPMRHVKRYIKEVEGHLGATKETAYALSDFTRRLNWGRQRTLLRVHFALSEILQTLLKNQPEQAALELVQLLRAVHQCSLDQGSWKTAWLLLRYTDPVEVPRFGGEPQELERVAGYLKALENLEKKSKGAPRGEHNEDEEKKGKGKKSWNRKPDASQET